MANKAQNIPIIRFPNFKEEWVAKRLSDIAQFSKGKGLSKNEISENGKTVCIRYGELYTRYGEVINEVYSKTDVDVKHLVLSEANDVIIPASGETQIDIATASCVIKSGVALGGDLNIIKTDNNGVFLSYYLNNKKKIEIATLAQGISVVHLYSGQLATLILNLPTILEQNHIASFFTSIDQKITLLKQKKSLLEQYKKGIMQKIFSQQIRFMDDDGKDFPEWTKERFGNVASFYSGGTPLTSKSAYYDGNIPFIKSGEINSERTEQFISEDGFKNSSAKMVDIGDLLFALYGATSGEAGISKTKGAINQAVLCIRSNCYNKVYLLNFLQLSKTAIIGKYLQGGQGNLSADIVKGLIIPTPTLNEQIRIANFLTSIDNKINNCQKQIEKTDLWKKGLLQRMFI